MSVLVPRRRRHHIALPPTAQPWQTPWVLRFGSLTRHALRLRAVGWSPEPIARVVDRPVAWVERVIENEAARLLRLGKTDTAAALRLGRPTVAYEPPWGADRVRITRPHLSPAARKARDEKIFKRYAAGQEPRQIAKRLGLNVSTVRHILDAAGVLRKQVVTGWRLKG